MPRYSEDDLQRLVRIQPYATKLGTKYRVKVLDAEIGEVWQTSWGWSWALDTGAKGCLGEEGLPTRYEAADDMARMWNAWQEETP